MAPLSPRLPPGVFVVLVCLLAWTNTHAQSSTSIEGQVVDQFGAAVAGVEVRVSSKAIGVERVTETDDEGRYEIPALPVGEYRLLVQAEGFNTQVLESIRIEVGRRITQNFQLRVGEVTEQITITSEGELVEHATTSVGQIVSEKMVKELPLDGRHFLELGLLVAGSVTAPQGAFSASPMRGLGALAINTAGNREETVNYVVNGITLNNLTFSSISFQPSIATVQEFKVDNSTFSAEYGQSSGAVVNIATRSGANQFHGEVFEFLRNDRLDARNFFTLTSSEPPPFKRNQFGGQLSGPIVKDRVFFFTSYEGLRQRQSLDQNSLVLSDAQRASVTDPVIARLVTLIPRANFVDASGTPRFVGSANAPVDSDQWTLDINYNIGKNDRLHAYYALYKTESIEPRTGSTVPGFGNVTDVRRQIFTLNETHVFGPALVNELRFGFNRWHSTNNPATQVNPADFGINNGITDPIGLPQINIAGGNLSFGGPAAQPSGRGDTTFVVADNVNYLKGRHSLKFGGEFRQFFNNNFRQGTGTFNFPTIASFIAGAANSFSVTLGSQSSSIAQPAVGFFAQDNYKLRPNLTLELGVRYDWNITPTERYDRFIVFDPQTASLVRVGEGVDEIYKQNNQNIQPRVGIAWDPFKDGKTSVRAAYAIMTDQPMTSIVIPPAANPPVAIPLTVTGVIRFDNALNLAGPAGLAPQTIAHDFSNAYLQTWNVNVQRELFHDTALTIGYFGSAGTNLIVRRNINQPVNGVRPFPALSQTSPILPGAALGNITQVESTGNSSYNALWVSATRRIARGVQFNASYTWSKSLDYNSFSTSGIVGQDGYNLRGDRGLSDFDVRHRFVFSGIYDLPFKGNQLIEGWQLAAIVQSQSGGPINIVTNNAAVNGVANTLRPDVNGPVAIVGRPDRWFDTSAFVPVARFGNLGRNVVIGPAFHNTDVSVIKNLTLREHIRVQLRAEIFDVFNHANFGLPGNVVGTPAFGVITSTRFPTGETGSSRQIQFAIKLSI
ncbi:MAG TPA: TonB-dependent receptor [Pyrinomonadaceae bacterium]|nr:TonB-dependent receptor [Pyrinomonadaceae bacterium]